MPPQLSSSLPKQSFTPNWQQQNSVPAPTLATPARTFTPTPSGLPTYPPRPTSTSSAHGMFICLFLSFYYKHKFLPDLI